MKRQLVETDLPKWAPGAGATSCDSARNYGGEEPEGYAVLTKTRDSNILTLSNYDAARARLKDAATKAGAPDSVFIHSFSHWGFGHGDTIIVRLDAPELVIREAESIESALADYPVLDDSDYSARETEAMREFWEGADARERMSLATRAGVKQGVLRFARMTFNTLCTGGGDIDSVYDHVRTCATEWESRR